MTPLTIAAPLAGNTLGSIDSSFVIAEWRDAGGSSESPRLIAPWHVHHKDDEAWYVLEGELRVRVGAEEVAVKAGASERAAQCFSHGVVNLLTIKQLESSAAELEASGLGAKIRDIASSCRSVG